MSNDLPVPERHRSIAAYEAAGLSVPRIAELVELSPSTVYEVRRTPFYKALVKQYRSEILGDKLEIASKRLAAEVLNSVETLVELRDDSEDDAIRLRATENILDRGGLPRVQRSQNESVHAHVFSDEELAAKYAEVRSLIAPRLAESAAALAAEEERQNNPYQVEGDE